MDQRPRRAGGRRPDGGVSRAERPSEAAAPAYAYLTYDPSFTAEQDRIPIGGEDDDGGPGPDDHEPPPKGSYEQKVAGGLGFEPRQADPECAVLPLYHPPI